MQVISRTMFGRRFWIMMAIAIAAIAIYYPFSPAAVQSRGIQQLKDFELRVRSSLSDDPTLLEYSLGVSTAPALVMRFDQQLTDTQWARVVTTVRQLRDTEKTLPPVRLYRVDPTSGQRVEERMDWK